MRLLLTGCSGGGKSTLSAELARRGWQVVPEPGRRVIAAARAAGGDALPWRDPRRFAEACLAMATEDWNAAGKGRWLFDRGIVDAAVHLRDLGAPRDDVLQRCRYDLVVLAPPWPEIFAADADRRHDFASARAEYDRIRGALADLGHAPLILPKRPVAERADWLESRLASG